VPNKTSMLFIFYFVCLNVGAAETIVPDRLALYETALSKFCSDDKTSIFNFLIGKQNNQIEQDKYNEYFNKQNQCRDRVKNLANDLLKKKEEVIKSSIKDANFLNSFPIEKLLELIQNKSNRKSTNITNDELASFVSHVSEDCKSNEKDFNQLQSKVKDLAVYDQIKICLAKAISRGCQKNTGATTSNPNTNPSLVICQNAGAGSDILKLVNESNNFFILGRFEPYSQTTLLYNRSEIDACLNACHKHENKNQPNPNPLESLCTLVESVDRKFKPANLNHLTHQEVEDYQQSLKSWGKKLSFDTKGHSTIENIDSDEINYPDLFMGFFMPVMNYKFQTINDPFVLNQLYYQGIAAKQYNLDQSYIKNFWNTNYFSPTSFNFNNNTTTIRGSFSF